MSQLWQQKTRLEELKVDVKIVTFDNDVMAQAYLKSSKINWPLLLDPDQALFKAYGLQQGSWQSIYGLGSILKYLKLIFAGQTPGRPGKDWRQLGGDVLVSPDGIVRLHYRSDSPHDRPSVDSIISLITELTF